MGGTRDDDGFAVPPALASSEFPCRSDAENRSITLSDLTGISHDSDRSSTTNLVKNSLCWGANLAANNAYLRNLDEEFPEHIDRIAFSIAMNGAEERLYVSWKHSELDYHTQEGKSFLLQRPEDHIEFRKYALHIIDWGMDQRLKEIRDSLDTIPEEREERWEQ